MPLAQPGLWILLGSADYAHEQFLLDQIAFASSSMRLAHGTGRSHNSPPQPNHRSESGPAERIHTQGADKLSSFLQYLDEAENSHERADASLSLAPVQSGGSTPGLGVESHTYGGEAQRARINQVAGVTAVPPLQQLLQAPTSVRRSDLREVVPAPGGGAWEGERAPVRNVPAQR